MPENASQKPTPSELVILRVLWERGPSTVREVMDSLTGERDMGYTTVLKFLQIMLEKKLVARDDSGKTHVYTAATPAEKMQRRLVGDLLDKVFSGSVSGLVMHALGSKKASTEELREIRRMLDELDTDKSKTKPKPKP
ncbi:BlaI/MecI/CopY family transcriptional regulator [Roseimicrobium sp. ORNL1]|uniref:BlaI/MecI/CopY family transcriptional regulator n=1 Tax=Roseimicrobium sp. ORNL1 TaxID=2711231 RepID=UPI0013E18C63|nr:BlaI/MecI/CopY family transcriptional regulator [Roseimicrobium sp. ORNL1]QIF02652.1 BlaI/MecI/CopY family transcriptional regulator [Roseimicrobium sp. ORNL1]